MTLVNANVVYDFLFCLHFKMWMSVKQVFILAAAVELVLTQKAPSLATANLDLNGTQTLCGVKVNNKHMDHTHIFIGNIG